MDGKDRYSFPLEPNFNKEEILKRFIKWEDRSCTDKRLHYEILVSKNMSPVRLSSINVKTSSSRIVLGQFVNSSQSRIALTIELELIPREVGPGDWVDIAQQRDGESFLVRRGVYSKGGMLLDSLTKLSLENTRLIRRTHAVKDHNRIFKIQTSAPEDIYRAVADEFYISHSSLVLLHPENESCAETTKRFVLGNKPIASFDYPESWSVNTEAREPGLALWVNIDHLHRDKRTGRIFIRTFPKNAGYNTMSIVQNQMRYLQETGLNVKGAPLIEATVKDGFIRSWVMLCSAFRKQQEGMVAITVLEHASLWIVVGLVGPARETAPEWWAINKRAFEIVYSSLQLSI